MSFVLRRLGFALLVSAIGLAAQAATKAELDSQLAPYVTDASQRDYLATESAAAGVTAFHFIGAAALQAKCPGGDYGCSTYDTGSRRGDVWLNTERSGGTGVTNITHEVAHIAAFRQGCYAHGDLWLEYLMGMAQRYESAFPGARWGKSDPTDSVQQKYKRYATERKQCKTANTEDLQLGITRVELQVPAELTDALTGQVGIIIYSQKAGATTLTTELKTPLQPVGPGLFALDLTSPKQQKAVRNGDTFCINLGKQYYLGLAVGGTLPGICYVAGGVLSTDPAALMWAPTPDGVLKARFVKVLKR